ncbi:MAG TPA: bifunctional precorrin-2 dehydrogenase/sirohydrochlorin ferrochelatase [Actinomycetota bacterium]|nr:bifunctional precorrin-2 dehydrogenase/sirohydrochlorin ferrochelatase [Actinomycetota bacterium]
MPPRYPILVDLAGRQAVVAGGGPVAERKARGLLAAAAAVRVVSPEVTPGLAALAERGEVTVRARPWRPGDLDGAVLVVAATGDPASNREVAEQGRSRGVLVNLVDDPDHGGFTVPAVLRRGDLTVAVATSGRTPGLAGALRRRLEGQFGPEWAELVDLLAADRGSLPGAADQAAWDALLAPEVLEAVRRGQPAVVRERIRACRSSSSA